MFLRLPFGTSAQVSAAGWSGPALTKGAPFTRGTMLTMAMPHNQPFLGRGWVWSTLLRKMMFLTSDIEVPKAMKAMKACGCANERLSERSEFGDLRVQPCLPSGGG